MIEKLDIKNIEVAQSVVDLQRNSYKVEAKLINYVEELYKDKDVSKILVSTGKRNIPAINLYLKNGYVNINDVEIAKDVYISKFEKKYK